MRERIQLVIDTLQSLDIRSSYDNMRKLLGCINELNDVIGKLPAEEEAPRIEIVEDENGAAE